MLIFSGLVVGLLLGVVLHRGDFCMHSALRELVARRPGPNVRAYLVALAVQLVVVNGLASLGWLTVPIPPVAVIGAVLGGWCSGSEWSWPRGERHRCGPGSGPGARERRSRPSASRRVRS
jgi:hypothetical protein